MTLKKGKKPIEQKTTAPEGYLPYVDIKALETGVANYYTTGEKCVPCQHGDVLIVVDGSRSGLVGRAIDGFVGSTLAKVSARSLISDYLFYFLQGKYAVLNTRKKGTGTPHLDPELLGSQHLIVPEEKRQHQVISRIEELFSELDKAVDALQKAKKQLTVYRETVLKNAFEGKLTQDFISTDLENSSLSMILNRNSKKCDMNNESFCSATQLPHIPSHWKWMRIEDISEGVEYGSSKKSSKMGDVPVVRMGNIQGITLNWDDLVYSSNKQEIEKYRLKKNDVLFNRTNSPELVGKTAIYQGEQPGIFAGYLIRINQIPSINPWYLTYYLNSPFARQHGNHVKTDGVNQSNINGKKLCNYPFPLCTTEEQNAVVQEIDLRLSVCDNIERTINTALQQAAALRQSILKQAFEGKLIP